MVNYFVGASIFISFMATMCWAIILFQYLSGRDYWGMSRTSFVFPVLSILVIPFANLFGSVLCAVAFAVTFLKSGLPSIRERSIKRRTEQMRKALWENVDELSIELEPSQELFEKEYIGNFIIRNEPHPISRPFPKASKGVKTERPGDNGYGVVTEHDLD